MKPNYGKITINNQEYPLNNNFQGTLQINEATNNISIFSEIKEPPNIQEILSITSTNTGIESITYIGPKVSNLHTNIAYTKNETEYLEGTIEYASIKGIKCRITFKDHVFHITYINKLGQTITAFPITFDEPITEKSINLIINEVATMNLRMGIKDFFIYTYPNDVINEAKRNIENFLESSNLNLDEPTKLYLSSILQKLQKNNNRMRLLEQEDN